MDGSLFELSAASWALAITAGLIVGLNKSGVAGLGIVVVPLMAEIFPAARSVGILLPMLVAGDLLGVAYYRRHAVWKEIFKALPLAIVGIAAGYFFMKNVQCSDVLLKQLIGLTVILMLALNLWQTRRGGLTRMNRPLGIFLGLLGGFATMTANASGPVMVIYLLCLGLAKNEFIGTCAWLFLVINALKVPLHWELGNITAQSLFFDLQLVPAILLGFLVGLKFLKNLPVKKFEQLVKILTALAAIKLILS